MFDGRGRNVISKRGPLGVAGAVIVAMGLGAVSARAARVVPIDSGHIIESVACPSATQCTGVDHDGNEVTFNPRTRTVNHAGVKNIDGGQLLASVACPSKTECTAIQETSDEVTFNPQTGVVNAAGLTTIDSGQTLFSVACPSAVQCSAVDSNGSEVTFDPQTGVVNGAGVADVDGAQDVYGLACLSKSKCVGVDGAGRVTTFDPKSGATYGVTPISGGQALISVACPSASQCTAVPHSGDEVTFNPQTESVNSAGVKTVDSGEFENSVACPSTTQCTAIDLGGREVTFDPGSGSVNARGVVPLSSSGQAVACPLVYQCTAVDESGNEVTFDPQPPRAPSILISSPRQHGAYTQGEVVDARYSCAVQGYPGDVSMCSGPVASGSPLSTAPGKHSFTVRATNKAGKHSILTHDYTVYAANGSGSMSLSPKSFSRSSPHHTLTFTYRAARGGIWRGTLTLAVPAGWSSPSTSPTAPGSVRTSVGRVSVSGRTITVSIPLLAAAHSITITYGSRVSGGPGATAPAHASRQTWPAQERSIPQGKLTDLTNPPRTTTT